MDQDKLHALEDQCIQEHAPECNAACPLHVDARGLCAALTEGKFSEGLKIYQKTVPFPGILSRVCDQPCRQACLRKEIGGALVLKHLERAAVEYGGERETPRRFPKKPKRVAVIGSGMSGLTVAYDLGRKGYSVVVFEQEARFGGIINKISPELLPDRVIHDDFEILSMMEVVMHDQVRVESIDVDEPSGQFFIDDEDFDVVYLGCGEGGALPEPFSVESGGLIVDPLTYQTNLPGVFAGGSMIRHEGSKHNGKGVILAHSVVSSMAQGRSAAISMDRYLQKVSLTAARKNEGPYQTRLFTNIEGIAPIHEIEVDAVTGIYSEAHAVFEAQRCIQCECMECVKDCAFLENYGSYPKRYLREVYNNLSIVQGTRHKNKMINSCSLCGLCGEICPEQLNMAEVFLDARREMVRQKRMPPSAHDFALRDMQFSNGDLFSLMKHQPGTQHSRVMFFPGCQLSASAPQDVVEVYRILCDQIGIEDGAGVGLTLRCCGAPAEWAGRTDLFEETRQAFLTAYQEMGSPLLILACSSCYFIYEKYYPEINIQSLWVWLDQNPIGLPKIPENNLPFSIQDPCTIRHETEIQDSVRSLLQKMGARIEELPLNRQMTECCGYGGLMWVANPEMAKKVVNRRIQQSERDYITYCAMCRDFYANQGKATLHLLDLVLHPEQFNTLKNRSMPDFSMRHENRARLKRNLLSTLWREPMPDKPSYEDIPLILSESLRNQLTERLILVEDIQQVIEYAERTGNKLFNPQTGHFLAYYCPACVTYWVEYLPGEQGFEIFNTYCHRMTIEEEVQG